jgi:hypothetical protein
VGLGTISRLRATDEISRASPSGVAKTRPRLSAHVQSVTVSIRYSSKASPWMRMYSGRTSMRFTLPT